MNDQDKRSVAKTVGDICGSLTCFSVCFAVFVLVLFVTVRNFQVEALAIVSIMVGIALACFITRVTLFLSYHDGKPAEIFKPLVWRLMLFIVMGVVAGVFLQAEYNKYGGADCVTEQCLKSKHNIQLFLDIILGAVPVYLIVYAVVHCWYRFR